MSDGWLICWPWRLRFMDGREVHPKGAQCCDCGRDIARYPGDGTPICLYCALGRGIVAGEDHQVEQLNQLHAIGNPITEQHQPLVAKGDG